MGTTWGTVYIIRFGTIRLVVLRLVIAYDIVVSDHNRAPGRIIYLGACLIAAVRLAREEHWDNSPRG